MQEQTSISYPWPPQVNGLERIALSAQGDLQRVLSAFFARPIVISFVHSHTTRQATPGAPFETVLSLTQGVIDNASPSTPIVQTRQVHLQCAGKIVCTAISTVRITSPECAHLFLQEKYAIGQMFRRLEKVPAFELKSLGLGVPKEDTTTPLAAVDNSKQLWRKYTLIIPHFECEILEVFPSREMFIAGEKWLTDDYEDTVSEFFTTKGANSDSSVLRRSLNMVLAAGLFLTLIYEVVVYNSGRLRLC